ncbi:hypothetical protein GCM10018952_74450 [Streptosporangium vulgare]
MPVNATFRAGSRAPGEPPGRRPRDAAGDTPGRGPLGRGGDAPGRRLAGTRPVTCRARRLPGKILGKGAL